ncbi:unnamed protein product, partial [Arabidopsis halleri]
PTLAQSTFHRNNQTFINLRGILIGNPILDQNTEEEGELKFMLSHALISQE